MCCLCNSATCGERKGGRGAMDLGWSSVWPPTGTLDLSVNPVSIVVTLLGVHLICSSYQQFKPLTHGDFSDVAYQR